jgi:hypothetical protein
MAGFTGREGNFAFAKFGTNSWGVAASVTKGAYFASDGGATYQPQRVNDDAFGQAFLGAGDFGNVTAVDVTIQQRARYDDWSYIIEALAMGSPAAVTISTSASGQVTSWSHILDLAPSIDGLGLTFAIDKVLFVDELTSAKVYGFSWGLGDSGVFDESFKLLGTQMTNISSINTRSTVNGATFKAIDNRVFQKQTTVRLNAQAAGSLTSTDAIAVEAAEITFERPQDAPHVTGQDYVFEPGDNGHPTVRVSWTYPRMTTISANSLYQALRDDTNLKGDITAQGALINSTDRYTVRFQFPHLELDEWQATVTGPNQVKPRVTFTAKQASSAPTGMTGITRPFRLTRIMTNSLGAFSA